MEDGSEPGGDGEGPEGQAAAEIFSLPGLGLGCSLSCFFLNCPTNNLPGETGGDSAGWWYPCVASCLFACGMPGSQNDRLTFRSVLGHRMTDPEMLLHKGLIGLGQK